MYKDNKYRKSQNSVSDKIPVRFVTGTWYGELHSTDRKLIPYKLTLNDDYTFVEQFIYRDQSDKVFYKRGNWELNSDSLIVFKLNKISFSKIYSAKMFCPDEEIEDIIIKTIGENTLTYKIDNLNLILKDENGTQMTLKKVDL